MKKFDFRLKKILELRKMKEKEAQREFAEKEMEKNKKEELLEIIKHQQNQLVLGQSEKKGNFDIKYYRNFYSYLSTKKIEENNAELDIFNKTKELEKYRLNYLKKVKDRKILESLEEKKKLEHKKNSLKEEQKVFDDIANRRGANGKKI